MSPLIRKEAAQRGSVTWQLTAGEMVKVLGPAFKCELPELLLGFPLPSVFISEAG